MSLCLVALVVFAVLGIFSARYRKWFRESLGCVTRMATLRPCDTGFKEKVQAKVVSSAMKKSERMARTLNRYFEVVSLIFTIAFFASLAYTAYGFYNLAMVGSCDPANPENCVFNPGGDPNRVICPFENYNPGNSINISGGFHEIEGVEPAKVNGRVLVYFIGTNQCPHCKWERPIMKSVADNFPQYIEFREVELDANPSKESTEVFKHYSPAGYIPLIVIGGKWFRVGSGEMFGEAAERETLTEFLCRATGRPAGLCG
jgi:glutaredoxin